MEQCLIQIAYIAFATDDFTSMQTYSMSLLSDIFKHECDYFGLWRYITIKNWIVVGPLFIAKFPVCSYLIEPQPQFKMYWPILGVHKAWPWLTDYYTTDGLRWIIDPECL